MQARRGFTLLWCIVAARDVGAPHLRRRWFCVGVREAQQNDMLRLAALLAAQNKGPRRGRGNEMSRDQQQWPTYTPFTKQWLLQEDAGPAGFQRTLCTRGVDEPVSKSAVSATSKRAFLLGNAVVPDAARHAFMHLLQQLLSAAGGQHLCTRRRAGSRLCSARAATIDWPEGGMVHNNIMFDTACSRSTAHATAPADHPHTRDIQQTTRLQGKE